MQLKSILPIMLLFGVLVLSPPVMADQDSMHALWHDLLAAHVRDGAVDYQGFKRDEAELDRYLAALAESTPETLPEPERLALYLNGK